MYLVSWAKQPINGKAAPSSCEADGTTVDQGHVMRTHANILLVLATLSTETL